MSAEGDSSGRFDLVQDAEPHYDQVPVGSLWRDQSPPPPPQSLGGLKGADLAVRSEPLPSPPQPLGGLRGADLAVSSEPLHPPGPACCGPSTPLAMAPQNSWTTSPRPWTSNLSTDSFPTSSITYSVAIVSAVTASPRLPPRL